MSHEMRLLGSLAYRAYTKKLGTQETADEFIDLPESTREAWAFAGMAVAENFKARTADVFYGYTRA